MANPPISVPGSGVSSAPGLFSGGPSGSGQNVSALPLSNYWSPPTRISVIGDSFMQQASNATAFTTPALTSGNVSVLNILNGQPWRFDTLLDQFGVAGGTSLQLLQQLPGLLQRRPDMAFMQGGHNDFLAFGASFFAAAQSNWINAISQVRDQGIIPVIILECTGNSIQGSTQVTLAQFRQLVIAFNQWKRFYCIDNGLIYWDWFTTTQNNDTGGTMNPLYTDDGVHPNFAGNMQFGQAGFSQLSQLVGPPTTGLIVAQNDVYDPTYNPYGNVLPSPLFLSGGGGLGSGFSGNVPINWNTLSSVTGTGTSIVCSVAANSNGIGKAFTMTVTGATSGSNNNQTFWTFQTTSIVLPSGTVVEAWVRVSVAANSPFWAVFGKLTCGANASTGNSIPVAGFANGAGPTVAWSGIIYVPPMIVPAGSGGIMTLLLQASYNNAANNFAGAVTWTQPTIRVVQNPY